MLTLRASPSVAPFRGGAVRPVRVQPCVAPSSSSVLSGLQFGERSADAGLQLIAPTSGMKWTMMRHGNRVKHLGRPADQRKALIRGLVTELLRHGAIKTTKTRAKVIRPYVEHMITLAKEGTLHARRQALAFVYDRDLVAALFSAAAERYGDRNGGYTRIKWPNAEDGTVYRRRGDGVEMAVIELV